MEALSALQGEHFHHPEAATGLARTLPRRHCPRMRQESLVETPSVIYWPLLPRTAKMHATGNPSNKDKKSFYHKNTLHSQYMK
jgi:hypothetical protein